MSDHQHNPETASSVPVLPDLHEQTELLELIIKAGRRCAYDLQHAIDMIRGGDAELVALLQTRAAHWRTVFNPACGPKDYQSGLHAQIGRIERDLREAEEHIEQLERPPDPLTHADAQALIDQHLRNQPFAPEASGVFDLIRAVERRCGVGAP